MRLAQRERLKEGVGRSLAGAVEENCGTHLTAVLLWADFERCTPYRFRPGATQLLAIASSPSAVSFTVATCLAQRETFEREGGGSLAGRSNANCGPLLMTVGLGADCNVAHCAPIPTRARPLLALASSPVRRFPHRRHLPAVHAGKNRRTRCTPTPLACTKWPAQRATFRRTQPTSTP